MLVLTRKSGQRIKIGNDIFITVVRASACAVKIGIEAPTEIPVFREELVINIEDDSEDETNPEQTEL
jgi:carbon storage regulator